MASVADCFRQHAPAYLQKFGNRVPLGHRKVLSAIMRCRTGELGGVVYQCSDCGHQHWVGRSCGNRHCPTCQVDKTAQWLQQKSQRLLPVHHFLVTCTVPDELRMILRANQRVGYSAIFSSGSETIGKLATNPRFLGTSKIGFFGVLHTWGRDPAVYHPHVHFVVPGGGVSEDGTKWLATPQNFLFPESCASVIYRAKFRDALQAAGLLNQVPVSVWQKRWEVDIKPVGDGQAVLKYLAPYVYRVAISDARIVSCDDQSVTYRYTPTGQRRAVERPVSGEVFVRSFAQHILPRHFQKVRHYGWMSANSKLSFDSLRWLVWLFLGWTFWLGSGHAPQPEKLPQRERPPCPCCGGPLWIVDVVHANCRALVEHSQSYLDSS